MAVTRNLVGNYVIERELGRGGMGVVYAAVHRVLGRRAAIKLLADPTQDVERFFNEARAAMAIEHPGVVRVYDVGRATDGHAYIAMELLDGESLAARLARGALPVRVAVSFARQIAEALAAVHAADIIHRDLKPENVIVVGGDRLKLVDFGVAKLVGRLAGAVKTVSGALIGTPVYMSPEQCEGVRELDSRSDLYSLGCMIFAMIVGRPPFVSHGVGALIGMHLYEPAPMLRTRSPAVSPALEAVVARLLAKSADDRFQSASELNDALADPAIIELAATDDAAATAALAIVSDAPTATGPTAPLAHSTATTPRILEMAATVRAIKPQTPPPTTATPPPNVSGPMVVDTPPPPVRSRRWLLAAGALALAGIAIVIVVQRAGTEEKIDEPPIVVQAPIDAAPPEPADADIPVAPRDMVTITFDGAPASTEVHVGGKLYGVVPRVEVPRGTQEVMLVLSRDGYHSVALPITPDRDQRVPAKLKPRAGSRPLPESGEPTQDIMKFPK